MTDRVEDLIARRCSRIIQIPLNGPVRYGTVLGVSAGNAPAAATLIEWDNGGEEWICDQDLAPLGIWFVSDEKKEFRPKPLEDLLFALGAGVQ